MPTYISLAISDTMFPAQAERLIKTPLTAEMVQRRVTSGAEIISALNISHGATIDAIRRRYALELPLPEPGPAPKIALAPGDELFVIQANFSRRLVQGEIYSDEEVETAPISFSRYRVPRHIVCPGEPPRYLTRTAYAEIIDDAYAIALWQRGEDHLKTEEQIKTEFREEVREFREVAERYDFQHHAGNVTDYLDAYDVLIDGAEAAVKSLVQRGYTVIFLTSRPEAMRDATQAWLDVAGLDGYDLIMKPRSAQFVKTVRWKAAEVRRMVTMAGREAVGSVLFIDDEELHRDAVRALNLGITTLASLADLAGDEPIIV